MCTHFCVCVCVCACVSVTTKKVTGGGGGGRATATPFRSQDVCSVARTVSGMLSVCT